MLYNLPGVKNNIHLSGAVVADMYLGKISKWNDSRIRKLNPGVSLPDTEITPVYRSDGSGTTFNFTDFLSASSKTFENQIGHNTAVDWPKGVGARGSAGVSGVVTRTPGAVGYADIAYALANKLQFAAVQNKSGKYALPGIRGIKAAAAGRPKLRLAQLPLDREPAEGREVRERLPDLHLHLRDPAAAVVARAPPSRRSSTGRSPVARPTAASSCSSPLPAYVVAKDKPILKKVSRPRSDRGGLTTAARTAPTGPAALKRRGRFRFGDALLYGVTLLAALGAVDTPGAHHLEGLRRRASYPGTRSGSGSSPGRPGTRSPWSSAPGRSSSAPPSRRSSRCSSPARSRSRSRCS